ncbi:hypothetical protein PIB30_007436 [Stylosanthes scabra]|uniref:Uncharacterized protein n=1 Tax=Stylosanthes scabra TaxID=79078 RepID=A0ABU6R4Y7_9FABA|nr:hypothetical protein [Stylosanthes scabra]
MWSGWVTALRRQQLRLLLPSRRRPRTSMQCYDGADNVHTSDATRLRRLCCCGDDDGMRCGPDETKITLRWPFPSCDSEMDMFHRFRGHETDTGVNSISNCPGIQSRCTKANAYCR